MVLFLDYNRKSAVSLCYDCTRDRNVYTILYYLTPPKTKTNVVDILILSHTGDHKSFIVFKFVEGHT
jgi:hypothetical protein